MRDYSADGAEAGRMPGGQRAIAAPGASAPMPRSIRIGLIGALLLALAGAVYLMIVRGDALLIDLAKLGRAFCF